MKQSRTCGSWTLLILYRHPREPLLMETPQALHHYWGHHTMEDAQNLEPKSDAEELLQIIDAMDICAQDLSSRAVVNILALIKTHDLHHICMLKKDEVKVFIYSVMCIIPMEHLTHFPCSNFTRSR